MEIEAAGGSGRVLQANGNLGLPQRCINRRRGPYSARYHELLEKRKANLPIWRHKEEFIKAFKQNQALILVAEPGSGKSTQVPQFVLEAVADETITLDNGTSSKYMIGCTQPQRVAAMSASQRVAEEMDVTLGTEVGYTVRFDGCTSATTVLNYLTDDMLLREAMTDPLLERYNVIILDEAHQRTLETDFLTAVLKQLLKKRPDDLKLVVMSANVLEAEKFRAYLDGAPVMQVPGIIHPVEIFYLQQQQQPNTNYLRAVVQTLVQIHRFEPAGDILVFLNVEDELEDACLTIALEMANLGGQIQIGPVKVVPLYPTLSLAMQQNVFEPAPAPLHEGGPAGRKIVVSTNVAENSLTIDGIVYVVDTGFSKQKVLPLMRAEHLVSWTSKASSQQRSSCAGRTQPGRCYRLYTEENFQNDFETHTKPEIMQSNLAKTVLTLKKLGIDDLVRFDFMDPPAPEALMKALEVLKYLGALDDDGNLTRLGEILSEFPVDPQMAKMLVASSEFKCSNEILSIAAMLLVPNCFVRPRELQIAADEARARFARGDGDHLMLLNVYNAYKQNNEDPLWCNQHFINHRVLTDADNARDHLSHIMIRIGLKLCSTDIDNPNYYVNIRKAMLAGYITQVAHLEHLTRYYMTVIDKQVVQLHPSNCLDHEAEWVIYNDCLSTTQRQKFICTVTDVRVKWLANMTTRYYDLTKFPKCAAKRILECLYKQQAKGGQESQRSREAKRVLEILSKQQEIELEETKKRIRIPKMLLGIE